MMRAVAVASQGEVVLPLQPRPVVPVASATLPAVPDMLVVPVPSGVGRGDPVEPPASWMSRWPPAGTVLAGSAVAAKAPVPEALAYWMDIPDVETGADPRLKIS